jgi:hypothetical protein
MTLAQLLAKNPGLDPKAYIQEGQQIKIGWAIWWYSNGKANCGNRSYDGKYE